MPGTSKITYSQFLRWGVKYPALAELLGAVTSPKGFDSEELAEVAADQLRDVFSQGVDALVGESPEEIAELESVLLGCLQCRSQHLARVIVCDAEFLKAGKEFLEREVLPKLPAVAAEKPLPDDKQPEPPTLAEPAKAELSAVAIPAEQAEPAAAAMV